MCPLRDVDLDDPRSLTELVLELVADFGYVVVVGFGLYQVDGTSAESATHHAGSENTVRAMSDFGQEVELLAAHLIPFAQPFVRAVHLLSEGDVITLLEGGTSLQQPVVFVDDVAAAAVYDRIHLVLIGVEHIHRNVAQ